MKPLLFIDLIKSKLSAKQERLFRAVIEPRENQERTLYIITPRSAQTSFYTKNKKTKIWELGVYKTSAISFPPYKLADRIPKALRGVITFQKIRGFKKAGDLKVLAHEFGHKLMNVSHESLEVCPQGEVRGDVGLMIYGKGVEIHTGKKGRWHRERLHLSPFLYRDIKGTKVWNPDYKKGGIYNDPIYGKYIVRSPCTI